jgi:rhodanese-related sulfurtransferase
MGGAEIRVYQQRGREMKWLARLTVNQTLAVVAFVLGAGALFAHPTTGATVRIDPQELAVIVQRGADRVAPLELANWIIEGRTDYRLIDLRDQSQYVVYHIPTAENIPLAALPSADIARNEKIIVYSDDGARSAQAWFLLRAKGFTGAYMVTGGIDGWKQTVLFPVLAQGADQASTAKIRAISSHFGGTPLAAAAGAAAIPGAPDQPAVDVAKLPPPPPAAGVATVKKPKKKEGC